MSCSYDKEILIDLCMHDDSHSCIGTEKVMFDLAHGQFQDTFVDPDYYDYVIPEYEKSLKKLVFSW